MSLPRRAKARLKALFSPPKTNPIVPALPPDTDVNSKFIYRPLNRDKNEIRLLRLFPARSNAPDDIVCELFHASLNKKLIYQAVSYAWGEPTDRLHAIRLNGELFYVRENLHAALIQFHNHKSRKPRLLWVDAVCIDQTNIEERNLQVLRMKMIYERADLVLVWLGPAYQDSDAGVALLNKLYTCRDSTDEFHDVLRSPGVRASLLGVAHLFKRRYFFRMWVLQELTVAKAIHFHCGTSFITADDLNTVQQMLRGIKSQDLLYQALADDSIYSNEISVGGLESVAKWKAALASEELSFFDCVRYHYTRDSIDPRDMVYGLAALANSKSQYQMDVDYLTSYQTIYTNLAKAELASSKNLDLLTWRNGPIYLDIPSWVPDWSVNRITPHHYFIDDPLHMDNRSGRGAGFCSQDMVDFSVNDDNVLTINAVVLGRIQQLGNDFMFEDLSMENVRSAADQFADWWGRIRSTDKEVQRAFVRTLLTNRFSEAVSDNNEWSVPAFTLVLFGYLASIYQQYSSGLLLDPILIEAVKNADDGLVEFEVGRTSDTYRTLEVVKTHWKGWMYTSTTYTWDRRFFYDSDSMMGLAPKEAQKNDLIVVAPGCKQPLILRPVINYAGRNHYYLIGEAYVDGYHDGEAIERLKRGELKLQKFEIR